MKKTIILSFIILMGLSTYAQCPDDQHPHFIDLGLPSGKGWACCNVCATSPEDFGGYFAYGEYWEKALYTKESYLYYEDLGYGYSIWNAIGTKTDISGSAGYDVAYKVMGEDWRMPTKAECQELVDSCTWEWTSIYGNAGYKVIGPNGNYIFLPAAGFKSSNSRKKEGERGLYRSSMWTMINGEASTSFAIDFTKDEVKVNNLGYRVNGLTVRPISSASMNCYVNNSFIEEQKGKEARGFTADGKSEIAITYKGGLAVLDEKVDLKFFFDDQEVDETVAGKVKEIQYLRDSISIILSAPKDFLVTQGSDYKVRIEVTPYCGGKPLSKVSYKYRVLRPGVVFIHGLGDNSSCFQNMISYLVDNDLYLKNKNSSDGSPQLFPVDYRETNTSPFKTNSTDNPVVKDGCESICKNLFDCDSIVSAKYDMVGHSMGGILARLYVQDTEKGKESTHKIITLNTPHYGSPLGNVASKIVPLLEKSAQSPKSSEFFAKIWGLGSFLSGDSNKGAIKDLAINSDEINKLNSESASKTYGIPIYVVGTHFLNGSELLTKYTIPRAYVIESIYLLSHIFKKDVTHDVWSGLFDNAVKSDGVVSEDSQIGGMVNYSSIYTGGFTHAFHTSSPRWSIPQQEITRLLLAESTENNFCMTGFKPFTAEAMPHSVRKTSESDSEYITEFEEPMLSSFINISVTPKENDEYTHEIKLTHSDDMATLMTFAILSEDEIIADYDKEYMYFNLNDYDGEITFYSIGRTNYNALLLDSIVVNINSDPVAIQSIRQTNENIHVSYSKGVNIIYLPSYFIDSLWQLYSLDGCLLSNGQSDKDRIVLNCRKSGAYMLKVFKNGRNYTYKLLLKS